MYPDWYDYAAPQWLVFDEARMYRARRADWYELGSGAGTAIYFGDVYAWISDKGDARIEALKPGKVL